MIESYLKQGGNDMSVLQITKENFKNEVLDSKKPVLVDFFATWCPPCQMLMPVITKLSDELKDAKIVKINVDEQPELAQQFGIMSVPTLMVMKEGKVTNVSTGVKPKQTIMKMLAV